MKKTRVLTVLLLLVVALTLGSSTVIADGPGLSQAQIDWILANGTELTGLETSMEMVGTTNAVASDTLNVYPYLAYTADQGVDFYPPPISQFFVGSGEMWMLDWFVILNHDVSGMAVIHILYNTGDPAASMYFVQDSPTFYGAVEEMWRFGTYFTEVPPIVGNWVYFPITRPYDGDGYPVGRNSFWAFSVPE